jgi:hypothetical protein
MFDEPEYKKHIAQQSALVFNYKMNYTIVEQYMTFGNLLVNYGNVYDKIILKFIISFAEKNCEY